MKNILVTGAAGFIGFHTSIQLLNEGYNVVGADMMNDYYDPKLKESRLEILQKSKNFKFLKFNISDNEKIKELNNYDFDVIIHLAAIAGVRHSFQDPYVYEEYNVRGTLNILEFARHKKINKIIFASSSSVYGNSEKQPLSEFNPADKPVSLYAVTKKDGELMCHCYHHLFGINIVCLRFFTVYGTYGRPDMAMFIFADAILNNKELPVFGYGKQSRSFTYVSDIVNGIIKSMKADLKYEIINLGGTETTNLMDMINIVERILGKKANKKLLPMQPGDIPHTSADNSRAEKLLNWKPKVSFEEGAKKFLKWYKEYYKVKEL